ncbi:MAG: hypothetical protein GY703_15310, partial [Gammaproteobacteria bacterium]|nr:hypothetical protein [Gammaproteobacteria bacterium]
FVSDNNLLIFDLTDPLDPSLTSDTPIDGTALKTSFAGDRAFVACGASGLQIFDISNLLSPSLLGQISEWSNCRHATATTSGDTVYAAVDTEGLTILEVSDPENYDILDTRSTVGPAFHGVLQDGLIYLSTGSEGLRIYEFDPIGLNSDDNQAQSIDLYTDDDPVARVALTAAYSDSIAFQVTVNGGTTWHSIIPEDGFFQFPETGTDVRWRANLVATEAGGESGPILDMVRLSLDRLSSYGSISSVEDIANDDGREVRLSWQASRHDAQGGEHTITEYSIYRRYDGAAQSASAKSRQPGAPYPPGQWDYLSTVPADFESQYSLVVPTLADSNSTGTNWTAFFVRTRTTVHGVFFDSPPDSGYSLNNLQPAAPTGWFVDYSPANGTQLDWNPSDDPQFAHFRVYRSLVQDTPVQPGTLFAVTTESDYFDETESHWYYQLTQVTHEGHESQPAHLGLSDAPQSSSKLHLMRNVPNPFNPITVLKFRLADDSLPVELDIFDVRGKRVRTFTAMDLPVGVHQIRWDGRDSAGRGCASGVYQARLRQGQEQQDIKMMLVR